MPTENRPPKIRLEWNSYDWMLEGASIAGLVLLFLLPAIYFRELPDIIPQHFNARGEADGFGPKANIWFLPFLGLSLYIMMTSINRWPHMFNYTVKITPENAERQYRMATRLIRGLKALIMVLFTVLAWNMIQGALTKDPGMDPILVVLTICAITGIMIWYFIAAHRTR